MLYQVGVAELVVAMGDCMSILVQTTWCGSGEKRVESMSISGGRMGELDVKYITLFLSPTSVSLSLLPLSHCQCTTHSAFMYRKQRGEIEMVPGLEGILPTVPLYLVIIQQLAAWIMVCSKYYQKVKFIRLKNVTIVVLAI